ncbi:MAG: hypothetical protein QXP84_03620 [Candidatus Korarchaeum sp.]
MRGFLRSLILPQGGVSARLRDNEGAARSTIPRAPGIAYPTLQFPEESDLIGSEGRRIYRTEEGLKYLRSREDELNFFLKRHRKFSGAKEMYPLAYSRWSRGS